MRESRSNHNPLTQAQTKNDWPFGDLPLFHFGLIMADPAWLFDTWSDAGKTKKAAAGQYRTMPLEEIKALPVGHLAAKDCLLWLWATHPMIHKQLEVIPAWGFKFVTSGVWVKRFPSGKLSFGTGYRLRCASEPFLIATNGNPDTVRNVRTVVEGPLRRHSEKPEEAYAVAEQLVPGVPYLELFSRTDRPGWTAWGDQAGLFNQTGVTDERNLDDAQECGSGTTDPRADLVEPETDSGDPGHNRAPKLL